MATFLDMLLKITDILFGSHKINVGKEMRSQPNRAGVYDLSIGVVGKANEVASHNNTQVKSGGLYIVVAPTNFMDSSTFDKDRNKLNEAFDLQVAYRLPNDIMPNFDVIVLKKK